MLAEPPFVEGWIKYPLDFDFGKAKLSEFGIGAHGGKVCRKGLKSMKDES